MYSIDLFFFKFIYLINLIFFYWFWKCIYSIDLFFFKFIYLISLIIWLIFKMYLFNWFIYFENLFIWLIDFLKLIFSILFNNDNQLLLSLIINHWIIIKLSSTWMIEAIPLFNIC